MKQGSADPQESLPARSVADARDGPDVLLRMATDDREFARNLKRLRKKHSDMLLVRAFTDANWSEEYIKLSNMDLRHRALSIFGPGGLFLATLGGFIGMYGSVAVAISLSMGGILLAGGSLHLAYDSDTRKFPNLFAHVTEIIKAVKNEDSGPSNPSQTVNDDQNLKISR